MMRIHWLCAAAALSLAAPSAATAAFDPPRQSLAVSGGTDVRVHRGGGPGRWRDGRRPGRGDERRGYDYGYGYGYYEPGQWARYNNRSWESDSFNDWWHDEPSRSMPRWTQSNRRECRQQYWTSAGWTC